MKIIHLTDPHLTGVARGNVYGLNPTQRLRRAIKSIHQHHADAAFIALTGDLANVASEGAYAILSKIIKKSELPIYPILGNHDNREMFQKYFPEYVEKGFAQYVIEREERVFLFLDTLVEGERYGEMCKKRLAWFGKMLTAYSKKPIYIFMHHHPVDSGLYEMDHDANFRSADAFWKRIHKHKKSVRHIAFGHLHRIMHASSGAVGLHCTRSTAFQVAYRPDDTLEYLTNKEKPTYAVMEISQTGDVRVHHHEYMDEKHYYEDGSRAAT